MFDNGYVLYSPTPANVHSKIISNERLYTRIIYIVSLVN